MPNFDISGTGKKGYYRLLKQKQKKFVRALREQQRKKKFKHATDIPPTLSEMFK